MKKIDKQKYGNIFQKNAFLSIAVDILVGFLTVFAIFGPIYQEKSLGLNYSVYSNIRLSLGVSSILSQNDGGILHSLDIILLLLLIAALIVAFIDLILNIVFLSNVDIHLESKIKKYYTASACKLSASAILFTVACFVYCFFFSLRTDFLSFQESAGLFFGSTHNMSAMKVLAVGAIALILVSLAKSLIGKQIEMHIKVDSANEVQDEIKAD